MKIVIIFLIQMMITGGMAIFMEQKEMELGIVTQMTIIDAKVLREMGDGILVSHLMTGVAMVFLKMKRLIVLIV